MAANLQVLFDHRPAANVSPVNFRLVETPIPTPGPGQVLVRHQFLSLDPYMRGRLSDAKSYAKPQEVGQVMQGGTVGVVEASENPSFKKGDAVVGMGGWQRYALGDGRDLRAIDAKAIPIQAYLGPVGMPGVTAWYGLNKIIAPKAWRNGARLGGDRGRRLCRRAIGARGRRPRGRHRRRKGKMRLRRRGARLRDMRRPQVPAVWGAAERGAFGGCRRLVRKRRRRAVPPGSATPQRLLTSRNMRLDRLLRGRADDASGHADFPRQTHPDRRDSSYRTI